MRDLKTLPPFTGLLLASEVEVLVGDSFVVDFVVALIAVPISILASSSESEFGTMSKSSKL